MIDTPKISQCIVGMKMEAQRKETSVFILVRKKKSAKANQSSDFTVAKALHTSVFGEVLHG